MSIPKWKLKAIVQKSISFLPKRERINYLFQKHITKGVELTDEHFGYKIQHAKDHIDFFKKYGEVGPDKKILELGSGWYPIIPILMYLTKSGKIISLDIQSWMTKSSQLTSIEKIKDWIEQGKLDLYFNNIDEQRWKILEGILSDHDKYSKDDINKIIGLEALIKDARNTGLEESSIDLICSNNTLEHIHKEVLEEILKEFRRVIKPGGVMSHFIDLSDHFAHFDKDITVYNFLKYSEQKWKLIDNKIQPQNRLRFREYKELYKKLNIPITEEKIIQGDEKELLKIKVHEEFKQYSTAELAITHGYIISKIL